MVDELTGKRHDYSHRQDIENTFTLLPENAPAGWEDPAVLWNEAEKAEKRKNSCVSREVLVALPAEMTEQQREELSRSLAGELVERYGVGVSVGIHRPDDGGSNYHAHILMTTRRIGPDGLGEKTRELDDMKQGPEQVASIREMVAEQTNEHLQRHGYEARVDHRSLADQRQSALDNGDLEKAADLSRAPTMHRGRKPEMSAKIEVFNENTAAANIQSQAKARGEFAELEEQARARAVLMAPVADTPKSREAMEQEQEQERKQKQAEEMEQARATAEEARQEVERLRVDLSGVIERRGGLVEAGEALAKEETALTKTAQRRHQRHNEAMERVGKWHDKHPFRRVFGEPAAVKKDRATAEKAAEGWDKANDRLVEIRGGEDSRGVHHLGMKEPHADALDKATGDAKKLNDELEEAKKDAELATRALKNLPAIHRQADLTPEDRAEERERARVEAEAAERKAEERWEADKRQMDAYLGRGEHSPTQEPPEATQERRRDQGYTMGM